MCNQRVICDFRTFITRTLQKPCSKKKSKIKKKEIEKRQACNIHFNKPSRQEIAGCIEATEAGSNSSSSSHNPLSQPK